MLSGKIHHVPNGTYALVAQLDRVTDYESVGRGFESLPSHHKRPCESRVFCFLCGEPSAYTCPVRGMGREQPGPDARPAGEKRPSGAFFRARESPFHRTTRDFAKAESLVFLLQQTIRAPLSAAFRREVPPLRFLSRSDGAAPLSAHSAARFGGARSNTKAMPAALRDRAARAAAPQSTGYGTATDRTAGSSIPIAPSCLGFS